MAGGGVHTRCATAMPHFYAPQCLAATESACSSTIRATCPSRGRGRRRPIPRMSCSALAPQARTSSLQVVSPHFGTRGMPCGSDRPRVSSCAVWVESGSRRRRRRAVRTRRLERVTSRCPRTDPTLPVVSIAPLTEGTIFNAGVLLPAGSCVAGAGPAARCNGAVVVAGALTLSGVAVWANQGSGVVLGPDAAPGVSATGCRFDGNGRGLGVDARATSYALTGNVFLRNAVKSDFGSGAGGAVVANNVLTGVDEVPPQSL